MWKLVIADDEDQRTVVNLVREEYSLGRAEGNAVRLTERNISRKHAVIRQVQGGFKVEDNSSYNGLFVNGVRVIGSQELAHGDVIQLGDYRIHVVDEAIDTQEQGYRLMAGESARPASGRLPHRLVELIGPNQGAEYPLEGERFLIGRGAECEFPIDHGSVSRIHAEIRRIGDGTFEVIDKGSANGLRVNGHALNRAILDSRDVLELGDVVLKYIPEGQVFHADAAEGARIAALAGSSFPPPAKAKAKSHFFPALFAAGVGAIAMTAIVLSFANRATEENTLGVPRELNTVATFINDGDLLGAGAEFEKLGAAERALAAYESLEIRWAEKILNSNPETQGDEQYRRLLDMVARRETLSDEIRERASKKLVELDEGAIDLSALEETGEVEAAASSSP